MRKLVWTLELMFAKRLNRICYVKQVSEIIPLLGLSEKEKQFFQLPSGLLDQMNSLGLI